MAAARDFCHKDFRWLCDRVARPAGLEPATYGLEGRCSIQLCYERFGAHGETRTLTTLGPRILSPMRLPIPPRGRVLLLLLLRVIPLIYELCGWATGCRPSPEPNYASTVSAGASTGVETVSVLGETLMFLTTNSAIAD